MDDYFKEAYKKFLDQWGLDAQLLVAIEEMSELTKALCKYKRYDKNNIPAPVLENVLEEIADVLNTAEQLKMHFGEQEVEEIRRQKIERALKRIR